MQVLIKDPKERFEGQDSPHLNNNAGAEDPKERYEGQDSPHSNNNAGAEDPKEQFEGQDSPHSNNKSSMLRGTKWPALEEYEQCASRDKIARTRRI
jgi:hypothetical protein